MWARTLCPFSSSTRNMAFGNGSVTVPSTRIVSSLGLAIAHHLRAGAHFDVSNSERAEARKTGGSRPESVPDQARCPQSQDREHLGATVSDRNRVFEVRGARSVGGHDGPAVIERSILRLARGQHRLDREHHALPEAQPPPGGPIVRNVWLLVHRGPDAVPDV